MFTKKKTLKESAAVLCDDHLGWQVYDDERQQQAAAVGLCIQPFAETTILLVAL